MEMESVDESANLLVYGPSGVGKTVFGGSAENVLFLAVEQGTISAKRQGSTAKVWRIKKWPDLTEAYSWLEDNPDHGFDWVVLDSLTQMQNMAMRYILDEAVRIKEDRDPDLPAIQDYLKLQNMFKRFVLQFCDLPVNVLFTALVRNETDEEDGSPFVIPDIQGKGYEVSQYICGMMSAYGYMRIKRKKVATKSGGERMVRTRQIIWTDTGGIRGKDRYAVLAPYTENKTLAQIAEMIRDRPVLEDADLEARMRVQQHVAKQEVEA